MKPLVRSGELAARADALDLLGSAISVCIS
jgi:hypothetical protein